MLDSLLSKNVIVKKDVVSKSWSEKSVPKKKFNFTIGCWDNCVIGLLLFFIDNSRKMKRQGNILNFLRKIPRTESSVEEATEIAIDDIHPSFMNNTDATSASDMSTVNTVSPADETDATSTSD